MRILLFILLAIISVRLSAQEVKGRIIDDKSEKALTSANILVRESGEVITSDATGSFTIVISTNLTLIVSYVGYESQEITLTPGSELLVIRMVPDVLLEEVIIKAIRATDLQPVAAKTAGIDAINSIHFGQDPVFSMERLSPSITAYSESGTGFANYSLMRLRGIDQSRINITLDGAPLNDMIDQGVFFSNFTDLSNSIESIQVQRGVGTSTNGTASYAGSVSFESLRLNQPEPWGEIGLTAGSFDSYRGSFEGGTGLMDNKMSFYGRYSKTLSNGFKDHSGTDSDSFFFSGGYYGEKDIIKITAFHGRTRNELAYLPVFIGDIETDPRTNYLDPGDEDDFSQQFVQVKHSHEFPGQVSLNSAVYYGAAGGDFPFGFLDTNGDLVQINYPLENDHFGFFSSFNKETSGGDLSAGIHTYTFRRINEEGILPDKSNPYYSDRSQKDEISGFFKISQRVGSIIFFGDVQIRKVWLDLTPDKQFLEDNGFNTTGLGIPMREYTFFSPKVGVTWLAGEQVDLYASFGRSGREPTRADILGSTTINTFNLDAVRDIGSVEAEYVNDFEAGIRFNGDGLRLNTNFFFMDFQDEIAPIGAFIPAGFVQLRDNISKSSRAGLEIDLVWEPTEKITLNASSTYMRGNINEWSPEGDVTVYQDVDPILSPQILFNGSLDIQVARRLGVSLIGRYNGESFLELTNDESLKLPEFFVADARISVNISDNIDLSVLVNNLFDKLYFTNGAPVDIDFDGINDGPGYLVQPPRNVFANLRLRF